MDNRSLAPIKFVPYLKTVIWGGDRIASYKNLDTDLRNIGESWDISGLEGKESVVADGEYKGMKLHQLVALLKGDLVGQRVYDEYGATFPLLVKIIDAKSNLSLQVHPDEETSRRLYNSPGKTEMWYIIDADDSAKIYSGFSRKITPDEYERRVSDNSLMDVVACYDSKPGDLFYLPAGRIHAIGAGNLLAEIQVASDITYRIYDYGRIDKDGKPRELHTELARGTIDYSVEDSYITPYDHSLHGEIPLIDCRYFNVKRVISDDEIRIDCSQDSFTIVVCIDGCADILCDNKTAVSVKSGETTLIPAVVSSFDVVGKSTLLIVTV